MIYLADIAEILVGYQSRAGIDNDPDGTHKLLLGRDFTPRGIQNLESLMTFTPERIPDRGIIESGDIIFQARGKEHYACCVENPPSNLLASSVFYIIRADAEKLIPQYLTWWLNQPQAQRYLNEASQMASISLITKNFLSGLEVIVPDWDTQKLVFKTNKLVQHEATLRSKITERRIQLADALCMKHISKGVNG